MDSNNVPFHSLAEAFARSRNVAVWQVEASTGDGTQSRGIVSVLTNGGHFFVLLITSCETRSTDHPTYQRCRTKRISERTEGLVALATPHGYVITTRAQADATDNAHDGGLYIEITVADAATTRTQARDGRSFVSAPMMPAGAPA